MSKKLKALVVEDMETDAELVLLALQEGGYHVEHRRVWSAGQLRDIVHVAHPDAGLSPHELVALADADLYQLKRHTVVPEPLGGAQPSL